MPGEDGQDKARARCWRVWLTVLTVVVVTGVIYRHCVDMLEASIRQVVLDAPLEQFPMVVCEWEGEDFPVPETVQRAARADDFMNRMYVNRITGESVDVYIPYTIRPRVMLGHKPDICYPAAGWVTDKRKKISVLSKSGRVVPCVLHWFHKGLADRKERVVLNFYIVNDRVVDDQEAFSGLRWRMPNIAGSSLGYVAQVQIGSTSESAARNAAADLVDEIIDYFMLSSGQFRPGHEN